MEFNLRFNSFGFSFTKRILLCLVVFCALVSLSADAATVAQWRFEEGPAGNPVAHGSMGSGVFYAGALDSSGNGNHLSVWQEGWAGYVYRSYVSGTPFSQSGVINSLSVSNSGANPAMFTSSAAGATGIDINTWSPSAFTIEVSYKPEIGVWRTIIGRDALGVVDGADSMSALYLQVTPANAIAIKFADVDGYQHIAQSQDGLMQGFDFAVDPDGLTGTWYHIAAVSDGTYLSLYVADAESGSGYELVSRTDMSLSGSNNTSLAIGTGSGGDWISGNFSVGRGLFDGDHTDRAYGFIDEIRISDEALSVDELLYDLPLKPLSPDLDESLLVDYKDLFLFANSWLDVCGWPLNCDGADLNQNGQVELADFAVMADMWNETSEPGLVGLWELDAGVGVGVADTLGKNSGRAFRLDASDWEPVIDGYCLDLDAQISDTFGEYIALPLVVKDDFTIALWVNTTATADNGLQWYSGKGLIDAEVSGSANDFGLSLVGNVAAFGVGEDGGEDVTIKSTKEINDGRWHHVAATRNSATGAIEIFVDGVRSATGIASTGTKDASTKLRVGSTNGEDSKYLVGKFDEIRAYDRVLNSAEIAKLANRNYPSTTGKKGFADTNFNVSNLLDVAWYYSWSTSAANTELEYVPMQFAYWWPDQNAITSTLTYYKNKGLSNYALGFNEPDGVGQADMTVDEAIYLWPRFIASGLPLGSPAGVHADSAWMQDFMQRTNNLGYRVDFVTVHWYGDNNPDNFIGHLNSIHNRYSKPIWVTEFAPADWGASWPDNPNWMSRESVYTFMAEVLWRMEELDYVKRYAWFTGSPDDYSALGHSSLFESNWFTLTPLGRLYKSFDGDVDGPDTDTWYYLHHQSSHQKLRRKDSTAVNTGTIWDLDNPNQWKLVDAGSGAFYIENRDNGRRFSDSGATERPSLVAGTSTSNNQKWKLVHAGYGWYHIDNVATNRRLHWRSDWTDVTMGQTSWNDGNVKWRFIKP